jgi:hypothetical protein
LIRRHAPQLTTDIRVLTSTELTPPIIAATGAPADMIGRLRTAFSAAENQPWFARLGDLLLIQGFADVDAASLKQLVEWDREARAAGFDVPA